MDYLQNHIWCSQSNWDNKHYDCTHLVTIQRFSSQHDGVEADWLALVDENAETFFREDSYNRLYKLLTNSGKDPTIIDKNAFTMPVSNLRPHVLLWLQTNVADRNCDECEKGWAIGSVEYREKDSLSSFSIFFHRKSDAMKFIKTFSVFKKPVYYCQYFTDVRKRLNLDTMKYEQINK